MSNDWKKAKQNVEEFREMMEEIEDYLPEAEQYSFDDGTEWENVNACIK
jgi:hypothetical protein